MFAIHDCLWCICTSFAVNFFTTSEINGSLKSSPSNNSSLYNEFLCLSTTFEKNEPCSDLLNPSLAQDEQLLVNTLESVLLLFDQEP